MISASNVVTLEGKYTSEMANLLELSDSANSEPRIISSIETRSSPDEPVQSEDLILMLKDSFVQPSLSPDVLFHHLEKLRQSSPEAAEKFYTQVLLCIQSEFLQICRDEITFLRMENAIQATPESERKQAMISELEESRSETNSRCYKTVCKFAELFKLKFLKPDIMIACVEMLLNNRTEESYQSLHGLLTIAGQELENCLDAGKNHSRDSNSIHKFLPEDWLENIYKTLKKISSEGTLSPNLRASLKELLEKRNRGYPADEAIVAATTTLANENDKDAEPAPQEPTECSTCGKKQKSKKVKQTKKPKRKPRIVVTPDPNAWKPAFVLARDNVSTKQSPEEKLNEWILKKAKGILNKITWNNFNSMSLKLLEFNFTDELRLSAVMNMLFEKAINEPVYAVIYAQLVPCLCENSVENGKRFRKEILDRCQREFLAIIYKEAVPLRNEGLIAEKTESENSQTQNRFRRLGNVRFLSELFKQHLLTPKIIVDCIECLLEKGDEECLECLFVLLSTCGSKLDTTIKELKLIREEKAMEGNEVMMKFIPQEGYMGNTVERLKEYARDANISYRIRVALLDLVDLNDRNWIRGEFSKDFPVTKNIGMELNYFTWDPLTDAKPTNENVTLNVDKTPGKDQKSKRKGKKSGKAKKSQFR